MLYNCINNLETMTEQEQAQELIDKYLNASFNCKDCDMPYCDIPCTSLNLTEAKECALICVDEIIKIGWNLPHYNQQTGIEYWHEVKTKIIKL